MSTMPTNQGAPVLQDISRQRKLAEQLRQQQELQGQMVSGHYVAPSWTQQLARALNPIVGSYIDKKADEKEKVYNDTKSAKMAELLKGMSPQQVQNGVTETSAMPAYEPNQMDRFGSPQQGVERQPIVTSTPNMQQETPQQQMGRVQPEVLKYMQEYGNTPEAQYMLAQLGKQDDRAYAQGQKVDDRQYADTREDKLYTRNRGDQVADREDTQEFQRIQMKEQQGFQLTMQEKQFAQSWKMQNSSQNFQAGQQSRSQAFQSGQNQLERDAKQKDKMASGGIKWKYDAASDEFVAPPTAEFPMGRRSGNIAKQNASKSMDYVIKQFRGDDKNKGALDKATQGGVMGYRGMVGKVTDSQDQRRFDNLKEQMSTELRTLFRIPGEGTLSDKEQAQYGIQLPSVLNSKETNNAILNDVENRIKLRNNLGANPLAGQDDGVIDFGSLK